MTATADERRAADIAAAIEGAPLAGRGVLVSEVIADDSGEVVGWDVRFDDHVPVDVVHVKTCRTWF